MKSPGYELEIKTAESTLDGINDLFTRRETMDAWMHERMLDLVHPLIAAYPNANWLTIGDGGADAWMLRQRGVRAVTASCISDVRLREAARLGHLKDIPVRAFHAECVDVTDASFDFVLCKETYHHVRRAPLAFYEFMRVSRLGFFLIEPAECSLRMFNIIRRSAKLILRQRRPIYDLFEPTGNYIYRVSEREVFRMLTAVQLPWFAIKYFNVFNVRWLAAQRRDFWPARALASLGIGFQDVLSACRLMSPGMCALFVPTNPPLEAARDALRAAHFRILKTPRNPYARDRELD
jgi:ubiquinone/menaquinone biosynthesis C-methylase UbiE